MDSSCAGLVSDGGICRVLKSVTGFGPRSIPTMGHRPPSVSCKSWCRSLNALLCRCVRNLATNLHPHKMCVLVRGERHLVHVREGPNFLRQRWTLTPHMTSSTSRLAQYEASECACMLWSAPRSLACCRMVPYVVVVEDRGFGGLVLSSIYAYSIVYVCNFGDLGAFIWFGSFGLWPCAQTPYGGSASVKAMSGRVLPSTTLRAPSSAASF